MLIKAKTLEGYALDSLDGEIGKVKDFYFDDRYWTIRYLIADTGTWLNSRMVLISPYALESAFKEDENISVNLTRKQIENSPPLDYDKPVSRQFEEAYYGYYGWPTYWYGEGVWGAYSYPVRDRELWKGSTRRAKAWNAHLRSVSDVDGYHIQALDGEIGHVKDFVIDDESWSIRYLIVNTLNWWPGKKVLISPKWIERVSWSESKVFVNLSRDAIKNSPEFTDEVLLTREYETGLYRHYNRRGYWLDEVRAEEHVHR